MELINLTPHPVHVLTQHGDHLAMIPSSGEARLAVSRVIAGRAEVPDDRDASTRHGIPVFASSFGELTGLPDEPARDTAYIVSRMVADYAGTRPAMSHWPLLVPDFVVRGQQGAILGCQGFAVAVGVDQAQSWGLLHVDRYGPDEGATAIGPEAGRLVRSAR